MVNSGHVSVRKRLCELAWEEGLKREIKRRGRRGERHCQSVLIVKAALQQRQLLLYLLVSSSQNPGDAAHQRVLRSRFRGLLLLLLQLRKERGR